MTSTAFPGLSVIQPRPPTYAVVDETVQLQCGIQPGALPGQYFATWFNGTTMQLLHFPSPSQRQANNPLQSVNPKRYKLDRRSLSLIITRVKLSDSIPTYHCELGVEDPRTQTEYLYSQTRAYDIVLEIVGEYQ